MALTRKFLSALGIDEDKQQAIIDAHTETVEGLKNQAAQYKADAEKLTEVQAELKKAQDAVKNSGDAQKIQEAFDKYKADVQAKETKAAKEAAMRKLAKDAGLDEKGIERAVKYGLASIELDEAGEHQGQGGKQRSDAYPSRRSQRQRQRQSRRRTLQSTPGRALRPDQRNERR